VARQQHVAELVPVVLEEDRQLTHTRSVDRTRNYLLPEGALPDIHHRRLYALQIVLETLQHGVGDFLQVFVVLLVEHLGDGVGDYGGVVDLPRQLLIESALVLYLEGLPDLEGEDHFERLALVGVVQLERTTFSER
jgi:hypothetical protein